MNDNGVTMGYRETANASGTPMPRLVSDALTAFAAGAFLVGAVSTNSPQPKGLSMTQFSSVGVDCPRCDVKIMCTLKIDKADLTVSDLADRFAEHYRDAGHVKAATASAVVPPEIFWAPPNNPTADDLVARAARRMGLSPAEFVDCMGPAVSNG